MEIRAGGEGWPVGLSDRYPRIGSGLPQDAQTVCIPRCCDFIR